MCECMRVLHNGCIQKKDETEQEEEEENQRKQEKKKKGTIVFASTYSLMMVTIVRVVTMLTAYGYQCRHRNIRKTLSRVRKQVVRFFSLFVIVVPQRFFT
jgi:hypothetical protein